MTYWSAYVRWNKTGKREGEIRDFLIDEKRHGITSEKLLEYLEKTNPSPDQKYSYDHIRAITGMLRKHRGEERLNLAIRLLKNNKNISLASALETAQRAQLTSATPEEPKLNAQRKPPQPDAKKPSQELDIQRDFPPRSRIETLIATPEEQQRLRQLGKIEPPHYMEPRPELALKRGRRPRK